MTIAKAGSSAAPPLPSLVTHQESGPAGPVDESEPRLSSSLPVSPMAHVPTLAEPALSGQVMTSPVAPADPSQDDPVPGMIALVTKLSADVASILRENAARKAEADQAKEEADDLRASVVDLEAMVLRELVADTPMSSEGDKKKEKKNQKSDSTTNKGDVQHRHSHKSRSSRKSRKFSGDDYYSEASYSSDEEEAAPRTATRGAQVPGRTEKVTRRHGFKSLVSYRSYRLADSSQEADSHATGKVNGHLKKLKHHLDYKFSGEPAMQVLDFLRTFQEAADLNGINEGVAVLILPYFLEGRAKGGLASRLKQVAVSMPKFPAAVQWLNSYATETILAAACQKVFTARQLPEEDEKAFANRLSRYAAEAACVCSEDTLISEFVHGLQSYTSNMVRGLVTPAMTFAEFQILAEQVGTAGRALTATGRPSRAAGPGVIPVRPRQVAAAVAESNQSSPPVSRASLQRPSRRSWLRRPTILHKRSTNRSCRGRPRRPPRNRRFRSRRGVVRVLQVRFRTKPRLRSAIVIDGATSASRPATSS
jgi:hypothetical protein